MAQIRLYDLSKQNLYGIKEKMFPGFLSLICIRIYITRVKGKIGEIVYNLHEKEKIL